MSLRGVGQAIQIGALLLVGIKLGWSYSIGDEYYLSHGWNVFLQQAIRKLLLLQYKTSQIYEA